MLNLKLSATIVTLSTLVSLPAVACFEFDQSVFEINAPLAGLYIQSVELIDRGHSTEATVYYNAETGTCSDTSYIDATLTVSGYGGTGSPFSGSVNVRPEKGANNQSATIYLAGFNVESTDNINIEVQDNCLDSDWDVDPRLLMDDTEYLPNGDSVAEETERDSDNINEGVTEGIKGITETFGW